MIALVLAAALAGVDRPIVSGADYLATCEGDDIRQAVACRAYLDGVVTTAQAFHASSQQSTGEPETAFICPGDSTVNMQEAALSLILADPSYKARPAAVGILGGLLDAYPCEPLADSEDRGEDPDQ
jgi:hypothetical protein